MTPWASLVCDPRRCLGCTAAEVASVAHFSLAVNRILALHGMTNVPKVSDSAI